MHMRSHCSSARASITPPKGVASEVKHSFARAKPDHTWYFSRQERKEAAARTDVCAANFFASVSAGTSSMQETRKQHLWQKLWFFRGKTKNPFTFVRDYCSFFSRIFFLRIFFCLWRKGSKEPLFTTEIIEIHFFMVETFHSGNWIDGFLEKIFSIFRNVEISYLPGSGRGSGVEGDGWKYGCGGEGVGGARRVWPCRPRSPLQNGTFWKESDASWGSRRGYSEKSVMLPIGQVT